MKANEVPYYRRLVEKRCFFIITLRETGGFKSLHSRRGALPAGRQGICAGATEPAEAPLQILVNLLDRQLQIGGNSPIRSQQQGAYVIHHYALLYPRAAAAKRAVIVWRGLFGSFGQAKERK